MAERQVAVPSTHVYAVAMMGVLRKGIPYWWLARDQMYKDVDRKLRIPVGLRDESMRRMMFILTTLERAGLIFILAKGGSQSSITPTPAGYLLTSSHHIEKAYDLAVAEGPAGDYLVSSLTEKPPAAPRREIPYPDSALGAPRYTRRGKPPSRQRSQDNPA